MYPPGMRGPNMEVSRNMDKYFTEANQAILERKVKKLWIPILIVHSDKHHVNKLNNAVLVPELKRQNKQLEISRYPGYGHGLIWG